MIIRKEKEIEGKKLEIEYNRLGRQASGCVEIRCEGTVIISAVSVSATPKEEVDFLPLTIEYKERNYAAGKIPGGFFKREGRPTEKEILTSRLTDRSVRPLFKEHFYNDMQVMNLLVSMDGKNQSDILSIIGTSAALMVSEAPFLGPVGAVRIGYIDEKIVINPEYTEMEESKLDIIIAGTKDSICMVEAFAKEVDDAIIIDALEQGQKVIKEIVEFQEEFIEEVKQNNLLKEKFECLSLEYLSEYDEKIDSIIYKELEEALFIKDKKQRTKQISQIKEELIEAFKEKIEEDKTLKLYLNEKFKSAESTIVRKKIQAEGKRIDGRGLDDIRPITIEVGYLPRTHGSALFVRGETQCLAALTLGTASDAQRLDNIEGEESKRFMLHYNFPGFCVGDTRPSRGLSRREIGHGNLAERALKSLVEIGDDFPYTIRLVCDILESNGSSSMASVCAGCLSLLDGGVPIKSPVAGIAMGLIKEDDNIAILTDILGDEDHLGDMDFKVAGTDKGITALQMDIKIKGLDSQILKKAIAKANIARLKILDKMKAVISQPRDEISEYAPRIISFEIKQEKIKDLIGPGGKNIRKIIEETQVGIDVDETGKVLVSSSDEDAAAKAIEMIKLLTSDAEVGKIYKGKVTRVERYGAFVEILPGKSGMVHISKISEKRVDKVEDYLKIGDIIDVKVYEIDKQGRINLTMIL